MGHAHKEMNRIPKFYFYPHHYTFPHERLLHPSNSGNDMGKCFTNINVTSAGDCLFIRCKVVNIMNSNIKVLEHLTMYNGVVLTKEQVMLV